MTDHADQSIDMIDEFQTQLERERRFRDHVFTQIRNKSGHLLAHRTKMGKGPAYLTAVDLNWVAEHVKFAADLPFFRKHRTERPDSMAVKVNKQTIDYIVQRKPDWSRQLIMTLYLAMRENHKFPPILAVAYKNWIFDESAEEWDNEGHATSDSIQVTDINELYCEIEYRNCSFFALDGQHRLMAILGLRDLIQTGSLYAKTKDGAQLKSKLVTRDDIVEKLSDVLEDQTEDQISHGLTDLMNERIGIEILPAVFRDENIRRANRRLRDIFVYVNEHAKKTTKGELALLDENNGFRIVARELMATHELLSGRVDGQASQLADSSNHYTTLQTLVEIADVFLRQREPFNRWEPVLGDPKIGYMRPAEEEIDSAIEVLSDYFSCLGGNLDSHSELLGGEQASRIRLKTDGITYSDNILMRPLAQVALAKAVSALIESDSHDLDLETIVEILAEKEREGQLRLHDYAAPWFGIFCDTTDGKMRRQKWYQKLGERLFQHLLGGGTEAKEDRDKLTSDFADARMVRANQFDETRHICIDTDGAESERNKVKLPHPWLR